MQVLKSGNFTGIVFLSVKDGGMFHWTCDTGFPVSSVAAVQFLGTIDKSELQYATEGYFLTNHPFMSARSDDFIRPPSRGYLHSQLVLGISCRMESLGNVIGKRAFGLNVVGKARFEYLFPDRLAIDIKVIHAQSGSHPACVGHLLLVPERGDKPTGTISRPFVITGDLACHHRRIGSRYPFGFMPCGIV